MQTTYNRYMDKAIAGMVADSSYTNTRSYFNAEASLGLPFGIAVARSPVADDGARLLPDGAAAAAIIGVTQHHHITEQSLLAGVSPADAGTPPKNNLPVLTRGPIWVKVEDAVTPESQVHVRHTATGNEQKGAFRGTADSTDTVQLTTGFRWLSSAGAGELAILEVNLP